jgi:hypothetical protein
LEHNPLGDSSADGKVLLQHQALVRMYDFIVVCLGFMKPLNVSHSLAMASPPDKHSISSTALVFAFLAF